MNGTEKQIKFANDILLEIETKLTSKKCNNEDFLDSCGFTANDVLTTLDNIKKEQEASKIIDLRYRSGEDLIREFRTITITKEDIDVIFSNKKLIRRIQKELDKGIEARDITLESLDNDDRKARKIYEKIVEKIKEEHLIKSYEEWLEVTLDLNGVTDCGEEMVREDFSNYADLEEIITFEKMQEIEQLYCPPEKLKRRI